MDVVINFISEIPNLVPSVYTHIDGYSVYMGCEFWCTFLFNVTHACLILFVIISACSNSTGVCNEIIVFD